MGAGGEDTDCSGMFTLPGPRGELGLTRRAPPGSVKSSQSAGSAPASVASSRPGLEGPHCYTLLARFCWATSGALGVATTVQDSPSQSLVLEGSWC